MAKTRNFCDEAIKEINRQLLREDTDNNECVLHIRNVLTELELLKGGFVKEYHYFKGLEVQ